MAICEYCGEDKPETGQLRGVSDHICYECAVEHVRDWSPYDKDKRYQTQAEG